MPDIDFTLKVHERIRDAAKSHGLTDATVDLFLGEALDISHKRLAASQVKSLAAQLILENKLNAATAQNPTT